MAFICRDEAAYLTGESVVMDGGCSWPPSRTAAPHRRRAFDAELPAPAAAGSTADRGGSIVRHVRGQAVAFAVLAVLVAPSAAAAADSLSTTDRLDDRRFVVSGPRAYGVATEAGRYPAMAFTPAARWGGIWSPSLKLLDGVWFGIDGQWIGSATEFTSG